MGWFSRKNEVVDEKAALNSGLRMYIQKMDATGVKTSLATGADPNGNAEDEISPMVLAATSFVSTLPTHKRNQQEIIKSLLAAGGNPSWGGKDGQAPYEIALRKSWVDVVRIMIDQGASPHAIEGSLSTPLQVVLTPPDYKGHPLVPMLEALIGLDADVNDEGRLKKHPLILALIQAPVLSKAPDYEDALRLLIEQGADLDAESPQQETARSLLKKSQWSHLLDDK